MGLGPKKSPKLGGKLGFRPPTQILYKQSMFECFWVHNNRIMKNLWSSSLFNGGKPLRQRALEKIFGRCNPSFWVSFVTSSSRDREEYNRAYPRPNWCNFDTFFKHWRLIRSLPLKRKTRRCRKICAEVHYQYLALWFVALIVYFLFWFLCNGCIILPLSIFFFSLISKWYINSCKILNQSLLKIISDQTVPNTRLRLLYCETKENLYKEGATVQVT